MKANQIMEPDFEYCSTRALDGWVLVGEHFPEIEVWKEKVTNQYFQVHRKSGYFRSTKPTTSEHEIAQYGDWQCGALV